MNPLRKKRTKKKPVPEGAQIDVDGRTVPVRFRVNARARRMILRVDARAGEARVTLPPGVARETAMAFVEERTFWIAKQLVRSSGAVPFEDGAVFPLLGEEHVIQHQPDQRTPVLVEDGVVHVGGKPEHLARRVRDWLKKEARREISSRAGSYADQIGREHGRITIRDTRSRWGSCSSSGGLNFSWRLVLAPIWVLDYVVAHEVAHLVEHNHSPAFWAVVDSLNSDARAGREWLSRHGEKLHGYG